MSIRKLPRLTLFSCHEMVWSGLVSAEFSTWNN